MFLTVSFLIYGYTSIVVQRLKEDVSKLKHWQFSNIKKEVIAYEIVLQQNELDVFSEHVVFADLWPVAVLSSFRVFVVNYSYYDIENTQKIKIQI